MPPNAPSLDRFDGPKARINISVTQTMCMRLLLTLLMAAMVALAGCTSDDDGPDDEPMDDEPMPEPEPEPEFEDFDNYELETATGHCHAKDFTEVVPGQVYQTTYNGGTGEVWLFQEANGVPGLQYEQNAVIPDNPAVNFDLALDDRCMDGDQLIL